MASKGRKPIENQPIKPQIGALVCIRWIDADQSGGWSELKDEKVTVLHTYGLYVGSNKHFVMHADTKQDDKTWGGLGKIPKRTVIGIDVIKAKPVHTSEL